MNNFCLFVYFWSSKLETKKKFIVSLRRVDIFLNPPPILYFENIHNMIQNCPSSYSFYSRVIYCTVVTFFFQANGIFFSSTNKIVLYHVVMFFLSCFCVCVSVCVRCMCDGLWMSRFLLPSFDRAFFFFLFLQSQPIRNCWNCEFRCETTRQPPTRFCAWRNWRRRDLLVVCAALSFVFLPCLLSFLVVVVIIITILYYTILYYLSFFFLAEFARYK